MKERRQYIAYYDDGHDFGEIQFMSSHRANSKANLEDAKEQMAKTYGYNRARKLTILYTEKCDWN